MTMSAQKQLFADTYLRLNDGRKGVGAEAARIAGYSAKTAAQAASRLLRDSDVHAYMRDRSSPILSASPALIAAKMEADEVLMRLTGIARGDVRPFLGDLGIAVSEDAPTHLVKRIKRRSRTVDGVTETEVEIELHDPQTALNMLGKNLRLFDRANELDWKQELEKTGVKASDVFEQLVSSIAEKMTNE